VGAWLQLDLPRAAPPPLSEEPWLHDAGGHLPAVVDSTLGYQLRRLRRVRGVEVEVHSAAGDDPTPAAEFFRAREAARLEALEDGRPRVLVLLAGRPPELALRSNQGLEAALDPAFLEVVLEHARDRLAKGRPDLALQTTVRRVRDRLVNYLDRDRRPGEPARRWPRRLGGWTEARWHRASLVALGLMPLGLGLGLLLLPVGRRLLLGPPAAAPPTRPLPFSGGRGAGGFGGVGRGGGAPPPGW